MVVNGYTRGKLINEIIDIRKFREYEGNTLLTTFR